MTEAEAFAVIVLITEPLRELNADDDWLLLVNGAPYEIHDEHGEPTGEYWVGVAWYCWERSSATAIPREMGNVLAVSSPVIDVEALYNTVRKGCKLAMGDQWTFRTHQAAKAAVFTKL